MRRRQLLIGSGALLACRAAAAQATGDRLPRIGILTPASSDRTRPLLGLRQGFAELGYVEGRNITFEFRFANGDYAAFPKLVAELVDLPVDVIVVDGGSAVPPAMAATKTIPIVIAAAGDPVALGFVKSFSRPGGNVTGFSLVSTELNLKRLDFIRRAFPAAGAVAVLFNPQNTTALAGMRTVVESGERHGLSMRPVALASQEAIRASEPEPRVPALVIPDAMFWNSRLRIIERLEKRGVPGLYPEREYADDGGLMAYGPNVPDNFRRAAEYADRILKGEKAGDLPIQQPARFDFVVNIKAAHGLGLEIPTSLLARADEVIE
jgi:putative ABC transport system substrate-binding protein